MKAVLITALSCVCVFGQTTEFHGTVNASGATLTRPMREVTSNQTGSCGSTFQLAANRSNGKVFACVLGAWQEISGSGNIASIVTYSGGTPYGLGAVVFYNGSSYVSLQSANSGNTPDPTQDTVWWARVAIKGDDGIGTVGPVGISWQGSYAAGTTYDERDGIYYNGSAFYSLQGSNTGHAPDPTQDTVWWARVAIKGADGIDGVSGPANYQVLFSAETTKTVTAADHGYTTDNFTTACWDTTVTPNVEVDGYKAERDPATLSIVITFELPFTGGCVVNATGGGVGGGGGGTYTQGTGISISGAVISVASSGVSAGSYGSVSGSIINVPTLTVDATGRVTAASTTAVDIGTGGGGGTTYTQGSGIVIASNVISIDTSAVGGRLRGTFSYDFGTVNNASCVAQTFSAPGAATGMSGTFSPNVSFPTGVNAQVVKVPSANTVQLEICNLSGSAYAISAGLVYTMLLGVDL